MANKGQWCYIRTIPQYGSIQRAVSSKGKSWDLSDTLQLVFLNGSSSQKNIFKRAMNDILEHANLFIEYDKVETEEAELKVRFGAGGNWSYLGSDALLAQPYAPTINIENATYGVCGHEAMHAINSARHEHQHPDRPFNFIEENVIRDLSGPPNNWDLATIRRNVLDKAKRSDVIYSDYDDESITCYFWPDSWIEGGKGTQPNNKLSEGDIEMIKRLYPFPK